MLKIRSVFRRLPSVTYSRGKYHVHGSAAEVIMMCTACGMVLEQMGLDTAELQRAIHCTAQKYIAGMAEGGETDAGLHSDV